MSANYFPPMPFAEWQSTMETLQGYAKVISKVRSTLSPRRKHFFHISLRAASTGLSTGPISVGARTVELLLDFTTHQLVISTSRGERVQRPIGEQSTSVFLQEVLFALASLGVNVDFDRTPFNDDTPSTYDKGAVEKYWLVLSQVDAIFHEFQAELREETSPVQLWAHHFDHAMLWFSGRLVPDQDPNNPEYADEQMNFGFVPGDEHIADPYFYLTAYPTPETLPGTDWPEDAEWQADGFNGLVMMYDTLTDVDHPKEKLINVLRTFQKAGAALMK